MKRIALAALLAALPALGATAAEMTVQPEDRKLPHLGMLEIAVRGDIVPGDAERFQAAYAKALATGRPVGFVNLDSPGGSVAAGAELARAVRASDLTAVVRSGQTCASACFLAFAAGSTRQVYRGARIGVHGASEAGRETAFAALGTIGMARLAAEFGASPQIVGRMVVTEPSRMVWLSEAELLTMTGPYGSVRVIEPER